MKKGQIDVLLGLQWGDEGKGKVVDTLVPNYDIIARFQGGPNAGHTIEVDGEQIILHHIPSGALSDKLNILGSGMVINPIGFNDEYNAVFARNSKFQVMIANEAVLIHPIYLLRELLSEAKRAKNGAKIGSTLRGIGPAYTAKYAREALRMCDITNPKFLEMYESCKSDYGYLLQQASAIGFDLPSEFKKANGNMSFKSYEACWKNCVSEIRLRNIVTNTREIIWSAYKKGQQILAEGAQGVELDVTFGDYPMVTSSHTTSGGVCIGLGVPPQWIGDVYGIIKAGYVTKVGGGEFPGKMVEDEEDLWQKTGKEVGATTGRKRMCGHHDLRQLEKAITMNGVTKLVLTKADICPTEKVSVIGFDGQMISFQGWKIEKGTNSLDSLPREFTSYLEFLEKSLEVPVVMIGTGPSREEMIVRQ